MSDFFIYYGLTIIALIITIGAQIFISSTYSKYKKVNNNRGISGAEAARTILDNNGLSDIRIEPVSGYLSDHYDPSSKVVRLSRDNYYGKTIGSVAVASHECGHAIQDKDNYTFMRIRSSLVPLVNFSSYAGYFAILIGCLLGFLNLIWLGIIFEVVILLFQLVTLPVEIDASSRALKKIEEYDLLTKEEKKSGRTVLTAAALTYVASVATAIIQILRLLLIFGSHNED